MATKNLLRRALPVVAGLSLVAGSWAFAVAHIQSAQAVFINSDDQTVQAPEDFHFSGTIESIGTDSFVVGGKTFVVDANTQLDAGLAVGANARVEFVNLADGSMLATEIETDARDEAMAAQQAEPRLSVDNSGPGRFADDTLQVNEDNRGHGRGEAEAEVRGPEVEVRGPEAEMRGPEAEVRGPEAEVRGPEAEVRGPEVEVRGPEAEVRGPEVEVRGQEPELRGAAQVGEDVHFSGTIEAIGNDSFVIGGKTFKVDAATMLDKGLAVGMPANVEFITMPDGTMLANEIETKANDDLPGAVHQAKGADDGAGVVDIRQAQGADDGADLGDDNGGPGEVEAHGGHGNDD